jgi:hypothetical protein
MTKMMIENFIKKINDEKILSDGTIKSYTNQANSIGFNITLSQPTLIAKLKSNYENPNSLALHLNIIILIRKDNDLDTDKLIKFRNTLSDSIRESRKSKLKKIDPTLPTADELKNKLENETGIRYVINYLMINYLLRNKDINLKFVKSIPKEKTENYIKNKSGSGLELVISDYKTKSKYGVKKIVIEDEKFISEFNNMALNFGEYLLAKGDGSKIDNVSTFNERIVKYTIDKLGQNKISKIIVKDLLQNHNYDELEKLAKDRGTSLSVILNSYNLLNYDKKPTSPKKENIITTDDNTVHIIKVKKKKNKSSGD